MWLSFPFDPETIERIKEDIPGALYRGQAVGFRIAAAALLAAADRAEGSMRESDGSTLCVRCGKIASHHGELQQDGSPPGCGWTYDMVLAANYQLRVDSCTNTSYSGAADFAERDQ